jgi:hypothetical protein
LKIGLLQELAVRNLRDGILPWNDQPKLRISYQFHPAIVCHRLSLSIDATAQQPLAHFDALPI